MDETLGNGKEMFLHGGFEVLGQSYPEGGKSKTFAAPRGPTPQWLVDKVAARRTAQAELPDTITEAEADKLSAVLPGVLKGVESYRAQRAGEQAFQDGQSGLTSHVLSARLRQTTWPPRLSE